MTDKPWDPDNGLKCPGCGGVDLRVYDSRPAKDTTMRRRKCINCGTRFSTIELICNSKGEPIAALPHTRWGKVIEAARASTNIAEVLRTKLVEIDKLVSRNDERMDK